jgi:hypothetical protein
VTDLQAQLKLKKHKTILTQIDLTLDLPWTNFKVNCPLCQQANFEKPLQPPSSRCTRSLEIASTKLSQGKTESKGQSTGVLYKKAFKNVLKLNFKVVNL